MTKPGLKEDKTRSKPSVKQSTPGLNCYLNQDYTITIIVRVFDVIVFVTFSVALKI